MKAINKTTPFGKKYSEVIKSSPGKSYEHRVARQKAWREYQDAKKQYILGLPERLKKYQEQQAELLRTKDERAAAKKARIEERNKNKKVEEVKETPKLFEQETEGKVENQQTENKSNETEKKV